MNRYNINKNVLDQISIDENRTVPIYIQLANSIQGLVQDDPSVESYYLPPIKTLASFLRVSRDTVEKAYKHLIHKGVICTNPGKGHYFTKNAFRKTIKVCLILNCLSAPVKELHIELSSLLGSELSIDTYVYNDKYNNFESIIEYTKNLYTHYLIRPAFNEDGEFAINLLKSSINLSKVIVLDCRPEAISKEYSCIYKNFKDDLEGVFEHLIKRPSKYNTIKVVNSSSDKVSLEIYKGLLSFAVRYELGCELLRNVDQSDVNANMLFLCISEEDLANVIEIMDAKQIQIGHDAGVIAYSDSRIKGIVRGGITTFSTDYKKMGSIAADMILKQTRGHVRLPLNFAQRGSA